jgi:GNAT superfamily N-acetyltransferase
VDHLYQEHEPGVGFFGFFEFVDDIAIARELVHAASGWLRERGMRRVIGPFNFNTNHEFGLLVDGFDTDPVVANPHNSEYFPRVYEKLGFEKAMDWYAYQLDLSQETFGKMQRISDRFMQRHPEISIRDLDMRRFDREVEILHQIYTDAWEQNWGHVRITDAEFRYLAKGFRSILDGSLCYVAEIDGVPAAMSVTLPDYNQLVKGMNGRLFPTGWLHFLLGRRKIDRARVFMLGVKREFQHLPLGAPIYLRTWDRCRELGYDFADASLILENNTRMRGALEKMGGTICKTYRNYQLELAP